MDSITIGQFRNKIFIGVPIQCCCGGNLQEMIGKFHFSMKKNNKPIKLSVFVCEKCKKIYLDKNLFEQNQMMMTTDLVCVDATTGKIYVKYERGGPSVKDNKSREESIETYKKVREFSIKNPFQGGGCSGK